MGWLPSLRGSRGWQQAEQEEVACAHWPCGQKRADTNFLCPSPQRARSAARSKRAREPWRVRRRDIGESEGTNPCACRGFCCKKGADKQGTVWINFWEFKSLEYAEVKVGDNQSSLLILFLYSTIEFQVFIEATSIQWLVYIFSRRGAGASHLRQTGWSPLTISSCV